MGTVAARGKTQGREVGELTQPERDRAAAVGRVDGHPAPVEVSAQLHDPADEVRGQSAVERTEIRGPVEVFVLAVAGQPIQISRRVEPGRSNLRDRRTVRPPGDAVDVVVEHPLAQVGATEYQLVQPHPG